MNQEKQGKTKNLIAKLLTQERKDELKAEFVEEMFNEFLKLLLDKVKVDKPIERVFILLELNKKVSRYYADEHRRLVEEALRNNMPPVR